MIDFYVALAFSVFFQILADKKQIRKFAPALRKAYMNLHANRLLFLSDEDFDALGQEKFQVK